MTRLGIALIVAGVAIMAAGVVELVPPLVGVVGGALVGLFGALIVADAPTHGLGPAFEFDGSQKRHRRRGS